MTEIPNTATILEIVEDELELRTGEPRHVTDVELEFSVEQDEEANWSVSAKCKRAYRLELDEIVDEILAKHPVIEF